MTGQAAVPDGRPADRPKLANGPPAAGTATDLIAQTAINAAAIGAASGLPVAASSTLRRALDGEAVKKAPALPPKRSAADHQA